MSLDMSYKFKKEAVKKNGSCYYKSGMGKRERPEMTPYTYGVTKLQSKKRGER